MAATGNRVAGRGKVKVNGEALDNHTDITLDIGGSKREPVVGAAVHGFMETPVPPKLEFGVSIRAGTSLSEMGGWTDETVTVEFDTGQVYSLRSAWTQEAVSITGSDGKAKVTMGALSCEELL